MRARGWTWKCLCSVAGVCITLRSIGVPVIFWRISLARLWVANGVSFIVSARSFERFIGVSIIIRRKINIGCTLRTGLTVSVTTLQRATIPPVVVLALTTKSATHTAVTVVAKGDVEGLVGVGAAHIVVGKLASERGSF